MTQGQFLWGVLQVWIQFSLLLDQLHTTIKEPILPYYLPSTEGRENFQNTCKIRTASALIRTRFVVSNSYDHNNYTTRSCIFMYLFLSCFCFVSFYGISIIISYSISNPVYSNISDMICKHKSTKLNRSKYCYVSLTIQLNISHYLHTVKWSNSSISNYSI